jgi:hypothetical protein
MADALLTDDLTPAPTTFGDAVMARTVEILTNDGADPDDLEAFDRAFGLACNQQAARVTLWVDSLRPSDG